MTLDTRSIDSNVKLERNALIPSSEIQAQGSSSALALLSDGIASGVFKNAARILDGFQIGNSETFCAVKAPESKYKIERNAQDMPTKISDKDGKLIWDVKYEADGKTLASLTNAKGSVLKPDGKGNFRWVASDGAVSPVPLQDVSMDHDGRLHFYNPLQNARYTLHPDGTLEEKPDSRSKWNPASVENDKKGNIVVKDADGKVLRSVKIDGKSITITDADGSEWTSSDGGKTIHHKNAEGGKYFYNDADMTIDDKGNVSYNSPYGERVTEMTNGVIIYKKK